MLQSACFLSGYKCCGDHSTILAVKQMLKYTFKGFFSSSVDYFCSVLLLLHPLSLFLCLCSSLQKKQNLEDPKLLWHLTCKETCVTVYFNR